MFSPPSRKKKKKNHFFLFYFKINFFTTDQKKFSNPIVWVRIVAARLKELAKQTKAQQAGI